jgi:hypothetical protein
MRKELATVLALLSPLTSTAHSQLFPPARTPQQVCPLAIPKSGFVAGSDRYVISSGTFEAGADITAELEGMYGRSASLADWRDLKALLSSSATISQFIDQVGLPRQVQNGPCSNFLISAGGRQKADNGMPYLLARHDGMIPVNWLVLDSIANHSLDLGRWFWRSQALIVIHNSNQAPANVAKNTPNPQPEQTQLQAGPQSLSQSQSNSLTAADQSRLYTRLSDLEQQARSVSADQSLTSFQKAAKLQEIQRQQDNATIAPGTAVKEWRCTVLDVGVKSFHGGNSNLPGFSTGYWQAGIVECRYESLSLELWFKPDDERLNGIKKATVVRFEGRTFCGFRQCDPFPTTFEIKNIRSAIGQTTEAPTQSAVPIVQMQDQSAPMDQSGPPQLTALYVVVFAVLCFMGAFAFVASRRSPKLVGTPSNINGQGLSPPIRSDTIKTQAVHAESKTAAPFLGKELRGIAALFALGGGLYFLPMLIQGTSTNCSALERRLLSIDVLGTNGQGDLALLRLLQEKSNGAIAGNLVRKQYSAIPIELGCAIVYWRITVDPSVGQDMLVQAFIDSLNRL